MKKNISRSLLALLAALLLLAQPAIAETQAVNVNTASAAELETLSGIGPAKAEAIIQHREQNGSFKTVDDLKLVRGIGDKLLERLRPQVTVGQEGKAPKSAKR